jgi:hypothetical protein
VETQPEAYPAQLVAAGVVQVTVVLCGVPEGSSASAEVSDGEIGVVEVAEAFGQKLRTS